MLRRIQRPHRVLPGRARRRAAPRRADIGPRSNTSTKPDFPHDDYGIRRSPLPWLTAEGGPTTRGRRTTWARDRIYLSAGELLDTISAAVTVQVCGSSSDCTPARSNTPASGPTSIPVTADRPIRSGTPSPRPSSSTAVTSSPPAALTSSTSSTSPTPARPSRSVITASSSSPPSPTSPRRSDQVGVVHPVVMADPRFERRRFCCCGHESAIFSRPFAGADQSTLTRGHRYPSPACV